MSNRVAKIKEKDYILWRHVPTESNPADIASRGCDAKKLNNRWFKGPEWMTNTNEWPEDIVTAASADSESEAKPTKAILKVAVESKDELDMVQEKFQYRKSMRVMAWIKRFIQNCQAKKENRQTGPLCTEEVQRVRDFWIKIRGFLERQSIVWQFNLSKAPWWGGQYERIIGLTKQAMYKVLGKAKLRYSELQELLLDIEVTLNNRPLTYVEEDIQLPLLTPNMMLLSDNNALLDPEPTGITDKHLRKRAKYLMKCRENMWKRWRNEYIRSLRERHNLKHKENSEQIKVGQVVIIKGDGKNRGEWNIGIVEQLIRGRDKVVRGARLKSKRSHIERAVELLYPLELECDNTENKELNPKAPEFRPTRKTAEIAKQSVKETFRYEGRELEDD